MNKTLVLFTSSYPYKGGEQFLETEIDYLSSVFKRVIIVPSKKHEIVRGTPSNVIIDDSVADADKSYYKRILALFNWNYFKYLSLNSKQNKFWSINFFYTAKYMEWIRIFLEKTDTKDIVFYSYWFSASTTALSLAKNNNNNIKYVTRTHRGDLYERVHGFAVFPSRNEVVKNINKVFPISQDGASHIIQKYQISPNKIEVSRLGIKPHGLLSKKSDDGVLRIVSCSSITKVKRVHLIIEALSLIDEKDIKIQWTHIGDGPMMQYIKHLAKENLNDNIEYNFLGLVDNKKIYDFYAKNPIDIFMNVSSSEGVPVSIMEAHSFGIPCIATDVGGNNEIVNDDNGYLINANPKPEDVSKIIEYVFNNKDALLNKSKLSYANWNVYYNADKNYTHFAKSLLNA